MLCVHTVISSSSLSLFYSPLLAEGLGQHLPISASLFLAWVSFLLRIASLTYVTELYEAEAAIVLFELYPDSASVLNIAIPLSGVHFVFLQEGVQSNC